jgi:hypothetical protein
VHRIYGIMGDSFKSSHGCRPPQRTLPMGAHAARLASYHVRFVASGCSHTDFIPARARRTPRPCRSHKRGAH